MRFSRASDDDTHSFPPNIRVNCSLGNGGDSGNCDIESRGQTHGAARKARQKRTETHFEGGVEGEGAKECRPGSLCRELERNEIPNRRTKLRVLSVRSEFYVFAAPSRGRGAGVLVATGSMTVFPRIPNAETKVSYQPVSSTTLLKGNQRSFRAHLELLVERAREGNGRRK